MQFTPLGSYSADDFPAEGELAEDEPADSDDLLVVVPEGAAAAAEGAALDSLPEVCEWDAPPVE